MASGAQPAPAEGAPPQTLQQTQEQRLAGLADEALRAQAAAAAEREAAADLGARAVLVAAYGRRLQRLAALLQQYDRHLQQALAALGLGDTSLQGADSAAGGDFSADIAAVLQQLEGQLATALLSGCEQQPPTVENLLQLQAGSKPLPAHLAAAGAPAVLAALQGSIHADVAAVNAWPAVQPPPSSGDDAPAAAAAAAAGGGLLGPAFARLHLEQRARWESAAQRAEQLEQLRSQVGAAAAALAGDSQSGGGASADAAARTQLAARQAGLRAELRSLEAARRAAEEAAGKGEQRARNLAASEAAVAALERREAAADAAVVALCAADSQVMRQWRQGSWAAQEAAEQGLAAQRQPLGRLAQQLLEAQRREVAAFREEAGKAGQGSAGGSAMAQPPPQQQREQVPPPAEPAAASRAAAQLLEPLAHLKTDGHVAALTAAAAAELAQLQPLQQRWAALAGGSSARLAALQQDAVQLEAGVAALRLEGGGGAMQALREAKGAAGEAGALVGRTRQALSEWWTSPAVTATPWVKREGKSAEEWLRLLGDQQRALSQREAFTGTDRSNSLRLR